MQTRIEVLIDAPPARVFAHVADIPRWPERISAITRLEMLTDGPVRVGTRFRETRLMFGREAVEEMTVAELTPPERLVLTASNHGTDYRMTHLITPEGAGSRLLLVLEGKVRTLAARLLLPLGWLMVGHVRRAIAADFADLKRSIESG